MMPIDRSYDYFKKRVFEIFINEEKGIKGILCD